MLLLNFQSCHVDNFRFFHFTVQVISFTCSFTNTRKNRYTTMLLAMLLINSMINTVFPTPAPPNKPIFPPRRYGANKSTTLIPVSKILGFVSKSTNSGAER